MRWFSGGVGPCALVAGGALLLSAFESAARAEEPGEFLRAVESSRQVAAEALRRSVQVEIEAARKSMADDPQAVIDSLKRLNDHVLGSADLSATERAELHQQVGAALQEAARRSVERDNAAQDRFASEAAARERQHALAAIESRQMRIDQLTKRIHSLLKEDRFELAEEAASIAAEMAGPAESFKASLPLNTRTAKYARDAAVTRAERQKGMVATLHSAEVAHVPQSDEPPIVYIDAAQWQELSQRRGKYSTDMYEEKPAEARIRAALDEVTELEFAETPLGDIVSYLKDRHGIEIQLDTKSLDEIGGGSDTPVTIQVRGVTLRSALRLLLRQLDLTYTVQDEVLLITTPETAAAMIVPHEYRVGDIVLPIQNLSGFGQLGSGNNNTLFGPNPGQNQSFNNQNQNQNNFLPFNNNRNGNPFGQDANNIF